MRSEYHYKTIALPHGVGERLETYRTNLSRSLGFQVSLTDTIGWLLKQVEGPMASPIKPNGADTGTAHHD